MDDEAFTHAVEDTVNGTEAFIASTDTQATVIAAAFQKVYAGILTKEERAYLK